MSSGDIVIQQLREYFAYASRLRAELVLVRDRLVRAELKIHAMEVALAERDADHLAASDSGMINYSNITPHNSPTICKDQS